MCKHASAFGRGVRDEHVHVCAAKDCSREGKDMQGQNAFWGMADLSAQRALELPLIVVGRLVTTRAKAWQHRRIPPALQPRALRLDELLNRLTFALAGVFHVAL